MLDSVDLIDKVNPNDSKTFAEKRGYNNAGDGNRELLLSVSLFLLIRFKSHP